MEPPHYIVEGWYGFISCGVRGGIEFGSMGYVDQPDDEAAVERAHETLFLDSKFCQAEDLIQRWRQTDPDWAEEVERALGAFPKDSSRFEPDLCYADLIYCHDQLFRLVGTWVVRLGEANELDTRWHPGGWTERPWPPKFMNVHDRRA